MSANLSSILKQSLTVDSGVFINTIEKAISLLREETGKIGKLNIIGRLIRLKPIGEAVVVGDLHGDLKSLTTILRNSSFLKRAKKSKNLTLVFLGDYGDRGAYSAEVYYTILKLKLAFPEQIILLRGNHEGPEDLIASPHDLPFNFQRRFKQKGGKVYAKTRELWNYLYTAVHVEGRFLMVHAGLPSTLDRLDDLARLHETHPEKESLEELLWSDPDDTVRNTRPSPRGAGKLFGRNITERILEKIDAKIVIRGHEPCDQGFKLNHGGKILTLFSRKGAPYHNAIGAYLDLPLLKQFKNAAELVPWIHKF